MTLESLLKSDLAREFERAVAYYQRDAADVLKELMSEYIESASDGKLFDEAEKHGRKQSELTEENAARVVREVRREG